MVKIHLLKGLYDYIHRVICLDIELEEDDIGVAKVIEYEGYLYILNHYGNLYIYDLNEKMFCYTNRGKQWRSINLIDEMIVANDGNMISSVNANGPEEVIIKGFDNLTGLTQDKVTGKIYGFENVSLVELEIER